VGPALWTATFPLCQPTGVGVLRASDWTGRVEANLVGSSRVCV